MMHLMRQRSLEVRVSRYKEIEEGKGQEVAKIEAETHPLKQERTRESIEREKRKTAAFVQHDYVYEEKVEKKVQLT